MRIKRNVSTLLVLFSLISLACSLSGLLPGKGPTGAPSGGGIYDENGQLVKLEPSPQDFMVVINARVAAGELSESEALIAGLKLFAGQDPQQDLFAGAQIEAFEGTELFDQAAYFLSTSDDEAAKAEIERLMGIILPSQGSLERFSAPAGGGFGKLQSPARPLPEGDEAACRALWKEGFPADADSLVCLLYHDFTQGGHNYRVYYPESKRDSPEYVQYVQAAEQALHRSLDVYSGLTSSLDNIDIIFALEQMPGFGSSGGPRAAVPSYDIAMGYATNCPVIVYPAAFGETLDDFRQIIAHEIFHCVTGWQQGFLHSYDTTWYLEAIANYFSNVVYPDNNLEFRFQKRFDQHSIEKSIFNLSYENTIFFQYLGNIWGEQRVFDMLGILDPLGSHEDHAAAMDSYGLSQQVFQEFGEAYMDRKIVDTGGENYPITLYYRGVFTLDSSQSVNMEAEPFHLARYLLRYKDKDRTEYTIASNETGIPGRNIAEPWPDGGPWRPLPTSFTSRCGADGDSFLLTTTKTGGTYQLDLDVTVGRTFQCDCVVGTWVQDTAEIESHLRTTLPGDITLVSLSGQFWLVVDDRGNMTFTPQDYQGVIQAGDDPPMTFSVTGMATSTYELPEDEPHTITVTPVDTNFVVTASVGGATVPIPLDAASFAGGPFSEGGSWQYECNDTTLTAMIPAGVAPFSTSSFQRVSDAPATPIPEGSIDEPGGLPGVLPLDTTEGGGTADCSTVQAQGFSATGDHVQWTLRNDGTAAVTIAAVSLNWPATNGAWNGIVLDGTPLWTGSQPAAPARVEGGWSAPPGAFILEPGAAADLVLSFASGSVEPNGYILVVDLADGCIISDVK